MRASVLEPAHVPAFWLIEIFRRFFFLSATSLYFNEILMSIPLLSTASPIDYSPGGVYTKYMKTEADKFIADMIVYCVTIWVLLIFIKIIYGT